MSSARQLLAEGLAKRADATKIRWDAIHVEPGFNLAETPEEFAERVAGMVAHLQQGGKLPAIEVRSREAGGVWLVDGHARYAAFGEADALGAVQLRDAKDGHLYVPAEYFTGNDADRVARLLTSAEGRTLSPLQRAEAYKRLANFGWSAAQIAAKVCKHPDHVRDSLALALANSDVHQMVKAGEVSATVAAKAARKHGEKAGAVLGAQVVEAKAEGRRPSLPKKPPKPHPDTAMLDFLLKKQAILASNTVGVFLQYPLTGDRQANVFLDARTAIAHAMAAEVSK